MKTLLKPLLAATLLSFTMGSVAMASPYKDHHHTKHVVVKKVKQNHHVKQRHYVKQKHHAMKMQAKQKSHFTRGFTLISIKL